jgi:hypothetical protein
MSLTVDRSFSLAIADSRDPSLHTPRSQTSCSIVFLGSFIDFPANDCNKRFGGNFALLGSNVD